MPKQSPLNAVGRKENAVPLYRQEQKFKRLGMTLSRQNLFNWMPRGASPEQQVNEKMKEELLSKTRCRTQKKQRWRFYVSQPDLHRLLHICGNYRTSGDMARLIVVYGYQEWHSGQFAKGCHSGFSWRVDGWSGYHRLEERRKFNKALVCVQL